MTETEPKTGLYVRFMSNGFKFIDVLEVQPQKRCLKCISCSDVNQFIHPCQQKYFRPIR